MASSTKKAPVARKARKAVAPPNESKRDKFKRLATYRINKAVKVISQIGNLSRGQYEYTGSDVEKMENVLTDAVSTTLAKFTPKQNGVAAPAVSFD